jgi:hypothetical protein
MAANHASSPTPFIEPPQTPDPFVEPPQTPDPYPERPTRLGGVRQPTPLTPHPLSDQLIELRAAHTLLVASLEPDPPPTRTWRLPILSTALNALGQVILGASIAGGHLPPLVGALACLLWMVCGLLLIAAQCLSMSSDR